MADPSRYACLVRSNPPRGWQYQIVETSTQKVVQLGNAKTEQEAKAACEAEVAKLESS
jgi:hypothetical protein